MTIGLPRRVGVDWARPVQITGLTKTLSAEIRGADAIHAAQVGLQAVRTWLEERKLTFTWLFEDGELEEEGVTGFARATPEFYGREFEHHCVHLVADEVKRSAEARKARYDDAPGADRG